MTAANDWSVIFSNPKRCRRTRPGPTEATAPTVYLLIGDRSPPIPLVKVMERPRRKCFEWLEPPSIQLPKDETYLFDQVMGD